ncbi:hypothetical protein ABZX30_04495 [Streptomyces sp. NPDC004542]|uniref:Rv1733c family protein n=1 Tax=Streptomyces sp. NPDC004542 TaxID=3154281 RepID=UPI0033A95096
MTRTRTRNSPWAWRWRRNPLRRPSYVVEAWIVLAAWLAALVGSVLAGLVAANAVARGLDRQQDERRPVAAVVVERAPGVAPGRTGSDSRVWVTVRWTTPDGAVHTGRTKVRPGTASGTSVTVWTDQRGRVTAKPLSPGEAGFRAAWTGTLVATGTAAAVFGAAQLARAGLERRRLRQWDDEWARADTRRGGLTG